MSILKQVGTQGYLLHEGRFEYYMKYIPGVDASQRTPKSKDYSIFAGVRRRELDASKVAGLMETGTSVQDRISTICWDEKGGASDMG